MAKKKQLHIIYIPGLGDSRVSGQQKAVRSWRKYGVHGHLFQMNWADKEPWEPKFERVLALTDSLLAENYDVAVVGASAGASAAMNVFAARKDQLLGAVFIAGMVRQAGSISPSLQRHNPAFPTSYALTAKSFASLSAEDRQRIQSRFSLADPYVPPRYSKLEGVNNRKVFGAGHFLTIAGQLTLGAPSWIRFLKRLR